ncbi:E2 ubiquitin-conjugating protein UBC6 [Sugiyamaella lignohabitans]|uniref:E2 ubiquitin-conjugating protein UBC6 n=1 Tax=Sugiyamaella lignohabitans TaxID=796027 RepID=A0A167C594_9ASCO|nr:E2 ubiquitin-conjugating protein UBC6 [Sugiyamaella lignohabitans]ANB11233.1 E2 ubiquitin-conjugating protein UBC6 [Sugiyamaella lignohabitans]
MMTPSGRFKTSTRLCLSISDYHPKTWNPAWSVSTILTGLLSFMVSDESTAGSMISTDEQKRKLARESLAWNVKYNVNFNIHFPEVAKKNSADLVAQQAQEALAASANSTASQKPNGVTQSGTATLVQAGAGQETEKTATTNTSGFSLGQKALCVVVVVASYVLASHLIQVYR